MGGVGRVDAIDDGLDAAGDDRERRPQLVADVGEEGPPLQLVGLEPFDHRVEPGCQLLDVRDVRAGLAEPDGVVAVLDATDRGEQPVQVATRAEQSSRRGAEQDDGGDGGHHDRDRAETGEQRRQDRHDRADDHEHDDGEQAAEPLAATPGSMVVRPATEPPLALARHSGTRSHLAGERVTSIEAGRPVTLPAPPRTARAAAGGSRTRSGRAGAARGAVRTRALVAHAVVSRSSANR